VTGVQTCALPISLMQPAAGKPAALLKDAEIPFTVRVSPDATVFQAETPPDALEFALRVMGQMVAHPAITQEMLDQVKQQIKKEQVENADPLALGEERFRAVLFGRHPYGKPVWGGWETVGPATLEDVAGFQKSCYVPNNAALIVAGNGEMGDLMNQVRGKFGAWVKGVIAEATPPEYISSGNSSTVTIEKKGLPNTCLVWGISAPSRFTANFYDMEILNWILGGGQATSRLQHKFKEKKNAPACFKSQFEFHRAGGVFQFAARVPAGEAEGTLQAVGESVETLKRSHVLSEELESAQAYFIQQFEEELKVPLRLTDMLADMELYDLAADYLVAFRKRIKQVSTESVEEAAKAYLSATRSVTVVVRGP
jgi:zinc protease